MISTDVKWMRHDMRGAPQIQGNAPGALVAALKALLVTGWGGVTALSVSVQAGIATATFNAGSSFTEHAVVLVAGATPAALNGEARVLTASNTQITFATTAPDGLATGTITIKNAPAGWEEVFSGSSKSVFRSADVTGARFYLRVDDSNGLYARVRGYEAMSDVDTGTGPFPLDATISGGWYWHKATASNATAIPYLLAADAKQVLQAMVCGVAANATYTTTAIYGFGDGVPLNPAGDVFASMLSGLGSASGGSAFNNSSLSGGTNDSSSTGGIVFARGWQGLGGSILARHAPEGGSAVVFSGNDNTLGAAPSPIDGTVKMVRMLLKEQGTPGQLRTVVPGVYFVPQKIDNTLYASQFALQDGGGALTGRKLAAVFVGPGTTSREGPCFLDVTGPWR